MREDEPASLLTESDSVAAISHLLAVPPLDAKEAEHRRRVRADGLRARHTTLRSATIGAVTGMAMDAKVTGRGLRDPTEVRLAARVVPALNQAVDSALWRQLVDKSPIIRTPARGLIYPSATRPAMLAIVDGVARVCTRALGSSKVTTQYARVGDAVHIGVAPREVVESWTEAATDTTVAVLPIWRLRAAGAESTGLALLIALHLVAPVEDADLGSAGIEHHPTTARIAGHLLELVTMAPQVQAGSAIDALTVRRVAVAAGVARSVTSRTLGALRRAGVVETSHDRVVVTDRERLARIARGSEQIA